MDTSDLNVSGHNNKYLIKLSPMKKANMAQLLMIFVLLFLCSSIIVSQNNKRKKGQSNQGIEMPITVNVFMENTGSMFGYYAQGNEFEKSVAALITNIQVSDFANDVKLHYINSEVFPSRNTKVSDFLRNMKMPSVCAHRGDLSITSVATLLDTILNRTGNNDMSVFVSDCVISPGSETNAVTVLSAEENDIANTFGKILKRRDLAVVIYRLESDFNGYYYDCNNRGHLQTNGKRPYFIWLIGNKNIIRKYKRSVPQKQLFDEMKIQNSCVFYKKPQSIKYRILGGDGSYDISRDGKSVSGAEFNEQSKSFSLSLYVNYQNLLSDESYLCDVANYKISNKSYTVKVKKNPKAGYTHVIKLSTKKKPLTASCITICLQNKLPKWVNNFSTEEPDKVVEMTNKTFGFMSIAKGLQKAYNFRNEPFATMIVGINSDCN